VILSADATVDQPKRLITLGATEYLTKPLRIPRILRLIDGIGETAPQTPAS
jgi:DNA-binding response OmpR family regulator